MNTNFDTEIWKNMFVLMKQASKPIFLCCIFRTNIPHSLPISLFGHVVFLIF